MAVPTIPNSVLARQILEAVDAAPGSFDVTAQDTEWLRLEPGDHPAVLGIRLDVASWAAHLAGHTLVRATHAPETVLVEGPAASGWYAAVRDIARYELGLVDQDLFSVADPRIAVFCLHQIADGQQPDVHRARLTAARAVLLIAEAKTALANVGVHIGPGLAAGIPTAVA